jgi:hypothetical protein
MSADKALDLFKANKQRINSMITGIESPECLEELYEDLSVLRAEDTIQNLQPNERLTSICLFVLHAMTLWKQDPYLNWKNQLRAALINFETL